MRPWWAYRSLTVNTIAAAWRTGIILFTAFSIFVIIIANIVPIIVLYNFTWIILSVITLPVLSLLYAVVFFYRPIEYTTHQERLPTLKMSSVERTFVANIVDFNTKVTWQFINFKERRLYVLNVTWCYLTSCIQIFIYLFLLNITSYTVACYDNIYDLQQIVLCYFKFGLDWIFFLYLKFYNNCTLPILNTMNCHWHICVYIYI